MGLDHKLLDSVREIVYPEYSKIRCWTHGWPHIENVEARCEELALSESEDPVVCGIAGYCHDLGRTEEEKRKSLSRNLGIRNHAFYSVKPTKKILTQLGINSRDSQNILEAVRVHSDRFYHGDNNIARILRDSDKSEGFGPWGVLRIMTFSLGLDIEAPDRTDKKALYLAAETVLAEMLKRGSENKTLLKNYLEKIKYHCEWYPMLETKSAPKLFKKDYEYLKQIHDRFSKISL